MGGKTTPPALRKHTSGRFISHLFESESRAKWSALGKLRVKMRIWQELESLYNPTAAAMEVNKISVEQTVIAITTCLTSRRKLTLVMEEGERQRGWMGGWTERERENKPSGMMRGARPHHTMRALILFFQNSAR